MNKQMIENKILEAIKIIDSIYECDSEDSCEGIEKIKNHLSRLKCKQETKHIKQQLMILYGDNPELKQIIDGSTEGNPGKRGLGIESFDRSESNEGYFTYHVCELFFANNLKFKRKSQISGEIEENVALFYNVESDKWVQMAFHKDDSDYTMIDNKSVNYLYTFQGLKITKKSKFRDFLSHVFDFMGDGDSSTATSFIE